MKYYILRYKPSVRQKMGILANISYVALDAASGGYPYPTQLISANRWPHREAAENYSKMFEGQFDLFEAEITLKEIK